MSKIWDMVLGTPEEKTEELVKTCEANGHSDDCVLIEKIRMLQDENYELSNKKNKLDDEIRLCEHDDITKTLESIIKTCCGVTNFLEDQLLFEVIKTHDINVDNIIKYFQLVKQLKENAILYDNKIYENDKEIRAIKNKLGIK